jgi:hypothetical protein
MTDLTQLEKRALSGLAYGERLRPERDWLVLLALAAVLFLISIAANVFIYSEVTDESAVSSSGAAGGVNTNAIDAAEQLFAKRAAEKARYESQYEFVDPSGK